METQTIINIVFAVAFVGYVVWQRNPTFDTIICKEWRVVDADGKERITASTSDGNAGVHCFDMEGQLRIAATTFKDKNAGVYWFDKDSQLRITAFTDSDGDVILPTKDMRIFKFPPSQGFE